MSEGKKAIDVYLNVEDRVRGRLSRILQAFCVDPSPHLWNNLSENMVPTLKDFNGDSKNEDPFLNFQPRQSLRLQGLDPENQGKHMVFEPSTALSVIAF